MKCLKETQEDLLIAYSSQKLDGASAAQVERHLESCEACRDFVRAQSALWEALAFWEAPAVSADFDRRLYRRIEQQVSWWDLALRPFRPAFRHAVPVAAAAAVVLMAGILLDRPAVTVPAIEKRAAQVETLQPEQVEHALAEIEVLDQFNHLMQRSDPGDSSPKM